MLSTTIQTLWSRRRRLLATSVAIVLGVAFLVATLVLGDTTRAGFAGAFEETNGGVDLIVRSSSRIGTAGYREVGTLAASLVDEIAAVPGVDVAVPAIEGTARLVGIDGATLGDDGPPRVGLNWSPDERLGPLVLENGRPPRAVATGAPVEVVVDTVTAAQGSLLLGSTSTVYLPQPQSVVVVGLATVVGGDSLGASFTAFETTTAQRLLLGVTDRIGSVRVALVDGADPDVVASALAERLPAETEVITAAQLGEEQLADVDDMFLGVFRTLLVVFAGIALVVAVFSIQNTFTILVAQRSRESALLRAVGAGRAQVLRGVLVEALAVGTLATIAGTAAGVALASVLQRLMVAHLEMPDSAMVIGGGVLTVALAVGVGATVLAAVAPALRAARVAPLAALRDVAVDRSGVSRVRVCCGAVALAIGLGLVLLGGRSTDPSAVLTGVGAVAVIVGLVVFGPVAAVPAAAVLGGVPATLRGVPGRLARRNAMRNPRRTAASAAALMVGTAVVGLFATFGASITSSIDRVVARDFAGDFVIIGPSFDLQPMSPELPNAVAAVDGVDDAVGVSFATVELDGHESDVVGADLARLDAVFSMDVQGGTPALAADELAVSDSYASDHLLDVGAMVTMRWADGTTEQRTVGAVYGNDFTFGSIVVPSESVAEHSAQHSVGVILVGLDDDADVAATKAAITSVTAADGAPAPLDEDEYVDLIAGQVDQMLFFVYGMLGVAVLIAVLGIANTLSLAIHERRRELGMLRAVGLDRRGVRTSVRWESVVVAVFGAAGGVGTGAFLGWGLVRSLGDDALGSVAIPMTTLLVIVGLAALAGIVAAVRPARRAARLDVLDALAAS